jgi:hypothetical protein
LLLVEAPIRLDDLPGAPDGPNGELERTARRAVAVLVRELNELHTPMIGQLEPAYRQAGSATPGRRRR